MGNHKHHGGRGHHRRHGPRGHHRRHGPRFFLGPWGPMYGRRRGYYYGGPVSRFFSGLITVMILAIIIGMMVLAFTAKPTEGFGKTWEWLKTTVKVVGIIAAIIVALYLAYQCWKVGRDECGKIAAAGFASILVFAAAVGVLMTRFAYPEY